MRVLIVSRPPLVPELGASQIALSLAQSLRASGHEVLTWSPEVAAGVELTPPSARIRKRRLADLLDREGRFDVIDAPADSVTREVARSGFVVARSVQPEILYRKVEILEGFRRNPVSPHNVLAILRAAQVLAELRRGRRLASVLLCLGSLEAEWTKARWPRLARRIETYRIAPPADDRERLRAVRESRVDESPGTPRRYLWIGRWSAHKGVRELTRFLAKLPAGDRVTIAGCSDDGERALARLALPADRLQVIPGFTRKELPEILRDHSAGLFTSRVEGWGLGLQEMLESGLPVFATRTGCVPDLEPYLGSRIGRFPPGERELPAPGRPVDWRSYEVKFSWPAIARDYMRMVESRWGSRV